MSYPEPTTKPCNDCPWLRSSLPGWLGPFNTEEWLTIVHGEEPIACHQTIKNVNEDGIGSWDDPKMRQCAGSGVFRKNVFKQPRDSEVYVADEADKETVFGSSKEFREHHAEANDALWEIKNKRAARA